MKVGVVGLGYVGLPLAIAFAEEGHDVVGVDADGRRVAAIGRGESYIEDVTSERLAAAGDRLQVSGSSYDGPRGGRGGADRGSHAAHPQPRAGPGRAGGGRQVAGRGAAQGGQLVVLESTTYPGTTRERLVPLLEESGLAAGRDFNVAFSPERVDPGRTDYTLRTTPKVVGGLTPACLERAVALYEQVCDELVAVSSPEAAELSKLLENVFRSVNIALVNELAMLCDRMGIDIWEVVDAAATKPYGFMRFEPGPGMGGHCLPVDPFYLSWKAREYGQPTEFVELAGEVNQRMPEFCVERIARALNDHSKPVRGSRIAILGVSYKPGVGDLRESPAIKIMRHARRARRRARLPRRPRARASGARARVGAARCRAGGRRLRGDRDRAPRARRARGAREGAARGRLPRGHARHRGAQPGAAVSAGAAVRVGVVGLGYWGPNLARNFDRLPESELAWLCDGSADAVARLAPAFPDARDRPATSTSCWTTRSSTPWWSPRRCPPTPSSPSACWRPASTASWRSRWPSPRPTPSAWWPPPRRPAAC